MRHEEFKIGMEFNVENARFRCTDIGTRTIIAINITDHDDLTWYNGPPYAVVEHVFDEYEIENIEKFIK